MKSFGRQVSFVLVLLFIAKANLQASDNSPSIIYPHLAADGVTSDDAALADAARRCGERGGKIVLPAGNILLTGEATITLTHCALIGVGAPGADRTGTLGTTILLTSETVAPFRLETGWLISGINFYWPDQKTGRTPYPPLFSDGGIHRGFLHGVINNIVLINAYDGMTTTPGGNSGDVKISNSTMWAYHYLFNLTNTGDSWALSNNRFTPGPLLTLCRFASDCEAAINEGNRVNALFHITAGKTVTLVVDNTETFSWRYGILIDEGGMLGASIFNVAWDGMGTLIDSSSGGVYAFQNSFSGSMSTCAIVVYGASETTGNSPCFNLGPDSGLVIHDFRSDGSRGDWIRAAGGNVIDVNNVDVSVVGGADDGQDYYLISLLKPTNQLTVRNSRLGAVRNSRHAHGIELGTNTMGYTVVQDCVFDGFESIISGTTNNRVVLTGNTSFNTLPGGTSVDLKGSGKMLYSANLWDVPPASLLPRESN